MKYKSCDFSDSVCKLNVLEFAFKTGIAQYKMNGKVHANNLKF